MSKVMDEAMAIVDNSDFNSLPSEERKRICKYIIEQQILTLYQVIEKDSHLTTKAWREKQIKWLRDVISYYKSEYRQEASATTSSRDHTCPYYQGVCGLDEEILCYCSSAYEMCDRYKEATE